MRGAMQMVNSLTACLLFQMTNPAGGMILSEDAIVV